MTYGQEHVKRRNGKRKFRVCSALPENGDNPAPDLSKAGTIGEDRKLADTLENIAKDEEGHYGYWQKYTDTHVKPNEFQIIMYSVFSRIFGVSFMMKLMEKTEIREQLICANLRGEIQDIDSIISQEHRHELFAYRSN